MSDSNEPTPPMTIERPRWYFVIRNNRGKAIKDPAGRRCWYETGASRADARARAMEAASTLSGIAMAELTASPGAPDNGLAEDLDRNAA